MGFAIATTRKKYESKSRRLEERQEEDKNEDKKEGR